MRAKGKRCCRNTAAVVRGREDGSNPEKNLWARRSAARRRNIRKATMVATLVAALLVMTAGIALAESFRGDDGPDTIRGSAAATSSVTAAMVTSTAATVGT